MINCSDNTYYIYYTDKALGAIAIPKSSLIQDVLDISLLGKTRLEYGKVFNENVLHLLEHYTSQSVNPSTPDFASTYLNLLENPVIGQLWYNNLTKTINVCSSNDPTIVWKQILTSSGIGGNSGILTDGEYIPLPISPEGYTFLESECVWNASPYFVDTASEILGINVTTDNRLVNCKFNTVGGEVSGDVSFIILGIKGEVAPVKYDAPCPTPTVTPTISVTPTVTPTITLTPTVTPTISVTPTVTPTITLTPDPTLTASPTVTPTLTPTITPTVTPTATPTFFYGNGYDGDTILGRGPQAVCPSFAEVTFTVSPNGAWSATRSSLVDGSMVSGGSGNWYLPITSGIGAAYEVKFTTSHATSLPLPSNFVETNGASTFQTLDTTRTITFRWDTISNPTGLETYLRNLNVEIRLISGATVSTGNVSIDMAIECGT